MIENKLKAANIHEYSQPFCCIKPHKKTTDNSQEFIINTIGVHGLKTHEALLCPESINQKLFSPNIQTASIRKEINAY